MTPPPYDPHKVYNLTPPATEDLSQLPDPPANWPGSVAPPAPPPPAQPPTWGYVQHPIPDPTPPAPPSAKRPVGWVIALLALFCLLLGVLIGRGTSEDAEVTAGDAPTTTVTDDFTPPTTEYRTTTTEDVMSDREIQELALDATWNAASASDRYDICEAVDLFGISTAAAIMNGEGGAEGAFDIDLIETKMAEWCQTY
jgi:hypothetical protein